MLHWMLASNEQISENEVVELQFRTPIACIANEDINIQTTKKQMPTAANQLTWAQKPLRPCLTVKKM